MVLFRYWLLIIFGLFISVHDCMMLKISNKLLVLFFALMILCDIKKPSDFFIERLWTAGICFSIFMFIYYCSSGMGFGDVKYAAVLGYAVGIEAILPAFLFSALGAIVIYVLGILLFRWKGNTKLPFAPFLTFGVFLSILQTSNP